MISTQHYDLFFPEPGVQYFINEDCGIIIWEGFFDHWFLQLMKNTDTEHPIEFVDYKNCEGWKDGKPGKINPLLTMESLRKLIENEERSDYKECYLSVRDYLIENMDQEIFIAEYL